MRNSSSFDQLDGDGDSSSEVSSEVNFNYEYAQMEVMMKTLGNNDPMQSLLQTMEQHHEEEKRTALERQRLMYEHELEQLRRRLSPEKQHYRSMDRFSFGSPNAQQRIRQWTEDREVMLNHSLSKLREQIAKANMYVQEANYIADEMDKRTEYKVTLQIPASSLNANRKRDEVLSEPAIQVRRKGKGKQIWSLEKLENRLVDIRDLYQEWKECDEDSPVILAYFRRADPFYDEQENHSLIGVANVFLESLFHDVKLQYAVPIINQKGEISGRLHVEVVRVSGDIDERIAGGEDGDSTNDGKTQEHKLVCTVKVLQATGLPQHLTNFVFCHYTFYDQPEPITVAPEVDPNTSSPISKEPQCMVVFDHCKEFSVSITEDLLDYLAEGALAIEVYGHKTNDPRKNPALWDLGIIQAKTRSLRDRWSEVTRKVELLIQILELNENGEFCPVEVVPAKDVQTGGIFQLRQGQSRRLQVEVRSVQDSGTLPLIEDSILSVSVGCVKIVHAKTGKGQDVHQDGAEDIDSYQDRDLDRLKRKWLSALTKRQEYLDQQLQKLVSRQDKTEDDAEREAQLLEMRLTLTEERNSVLVPSAGSGIPGAPANWTPVSGMETHIPVIFLDLNADDFSSQDNLDEPEAAGWDATLTGEEEDEFFDLQIVKHHEPEVKAEASWDCTVHNIPHLSKGSSADERVFLIVRVTVQLSHPAEIQLVLRKRICVNVYSRQGFAQSFLRRMSSRSNITSCGVTVEIVSNIPEDSQGAEDREALARMAADVGSDNSATYIEKYLRSVLAVENILTLDRLRQEVAVKEQLSGKGKLSRKSLSSPNVHRLSGSRGELGAQHNLSGHRGRWESQQDVSQSSTLSSRSSTSPRTTRTAGSGHNPTPDSGPESSVSSYLNPVRSLVPQMPKLLKSLLPQRDEKSRQPGPLAAPQAVPRIVVQSASIDDGAFKPKPVNHEEWAGIRQPVIARSPIQDKRSDKSPAVPSQPKICDSPVQESQEGPPSPLSEASSGYFSHSVSTATLSEALSTGSEVSTGQTPSPVATDISLATLTTSQEPVKDQTGKSEAVSDQHLPSNKSEVQKEMEKPRNSNQRENHDLGFNNTNGNKPHPKTSTVDVIQVFSGGHATVDLSKDVPSQDKLLATSQGSSSDSSVQPLTTDPVQSKVIVSPFKIQKVKTSELKSFTRMLGDELVEPATLEKVGRTGTKINDQIGSGDDPSEAISDSEESQEVPEWLKEGEYVTVGTNKNGIVRYVGPADFQEGMWVGVELDVPAGKNDGSVGGKHYFKCNPGYGVLVRPNRVKKAIGAARRKSAGLRLQGGTALEERKTGSLSGSAGNLAALTALAKPDRATNIKADARKKTENRKSWAN